MFYNYSFFQNFKKLQIKKVDELKVARILTNKLLVDSKALIGNKEKFYESIDKALTTYLKTKLNLKNSEFKK